MPAWRAAYEPRCGHGGAADAAAATGAALGHAAAGGGSSSEPALGRGGTSRCGASCRAIISESTGDVSGGGDACRCGRCRGGGVTARGGAIFRDPAKRSRVALSNAATYEPRACATYEPRAWRAAAAASVSRVAGGGMAEADELASAVLQPRWSRGAREL